MTLLIILFLQLFPSCDSAIVSENPPPSNDPSNQPSTDYPMYVYSNPDQSLYLVDYKTYEIVKKIPLNTPEGASFYGMEITKNRRYLFFEAEGPYPDPALGFSLFDIENKRFDKIFFTDLKNPGPVRFTGSPNKDEPEIAYAYIRNYGIFGINILDGKITNKISDEHFFHLDKSLENSPTGTWTLIANNWEAGEKGIYSEIEFYNGNSGLTDLEFILNKNNQDSIYIYDYKLNHDEDKLFLTYQLSDNKSRNIAGFLGSYDLQSKEFTHALKTVPWSLNPYYMQLSPKRGEIYFIGAYNELHIIDSKTTQPKASLFLPKKSSGPSQIQIGPNEDFAFISCPNDHSIFVIDLQSETIIKTIKFETFRPYNMIIP